jgi:hypothetical protein
MTTEDLTLTYDQLAGDERPAFIAVEKHADHAENGVIMLWAPTVLDGLVLRPGQQLNATYDPNQVAILAYSVGSIDPAEDPGSPENEDARPPEHLATTTAVAADVDKEDPSSTPATDGGSPAPDDEPPAPASDPSNPKGYLAGPDVSGAGTGDEVVVEGGTATDRDPSSPTSPEPTKSTPEPQQASEPKKAPPKKK